MCFYNWPVPGAGEGRVWCPLGACITASSPADSRHRCAVFPCPLELWALSVTWQIAGETLSLTFSVATSQTCVWLPSKDARCQWNIPRWRGQGSKTGEHTGREGGGGALHPLTLLERAWKTAAQTPHQRAKTQPGNNTHVFQETGSLSIAGFGLQWFPWKSPQAPQYGRLQVSSLLDRTGQNTPTSL